MKGKIVDIYFNKVQFQEFIKDLVCSTDREYHIFRTNERSYDEVVLHLPQSYHGEREDKLLMDLILRVCFRKGVAEAMNLMKRAFAGAKIPRASMNTLLTIIEDSMEPKDE